MPEPGLLDNLEYDFDVSVYPCYLKGIAKSDDQVIVYRIGTPSKSSEAYSFRKYPIRTCAFPESTDISYAPN